eukprot:4985700-Lingulodinium_polyedra.AAC.1
MPMGYANAMGAVQYLLRRCRAQPLRSRGLALPLAREVRKDRPMPLLSASPEELAAFWQVYCDDADYPRLY